MQRRANFQVMSECTDISPTASDTTPFVVPGRIEVMAKLISASADVAMSRQVLMGWINCSDKYLKKYSDLLSSLGYSSVRTIQPTLHAFSLYESQRRVWASDILEYLTETQQLPSRYPAVKQALAGLIFDSCPCWMSIKTGTMALTEGVQFPTKQLLAIAATLYFWMITLLKLKGPQRFWDRMVNEAMPVPHLYLYSGSDQLCEVHQLEPLIAKKQKQGLDMTVRKFENSQHCSHLRKYPQEYTFELQAFLKKVTR